MLFLRHTVRQYFYVRDHLATLAIDLLRNETDFVFRGAPQYTELTAYTEHGLSIIKC